MKAKIVIAVFFLSISIFSSAQISSKEYNRIFYAAAKGKWYLGGVQSSNETIYDRSMIKGADILNFSDSTHFQITCAGKKLCSGTWRLITKDEIIVFKQDNIETRYKILVIDNAYFIIEKL